MYYDDEARQFNFLSGLLLGAILGTGLALLIAPQRKRLAKPPRRIRDSASALRRRTGSGWGDARARAERVAGDAFTRIRSAADRVAG